MKLSGVKYLANQGIENIWKNKMMAFATFCVLLISLLLVGSSGLFYVNMNSMILGLGNQNEVAVYLDPNTAQERVDEIDQQIQNMDNVDTVVYIVDNSLESRYCMPLFNPLFCKNNMQGFRHRYPTHRNNHHQLL